MNNKFVAVAAVASMMIMAWAVLLQPLVSLETSERVGEEFCSEYEGVEETKFTTVGPTVGETLKERALVALIIALIGMILFITFVFRKIPKKVSPWKFGVTAIIALFHDIIIPVGVFVLLGQLFNIEV